MTRKKRKWKYAKSKKSWHCEICFEPLTKTEPLLCKKCYRELKTIIKNQQEEELEAEIMNQEEWEQ